MTRSLLFLLCASVLGAQTCTQAVVDSITHASARVAWTASGTTSVYSRVQFGTTTSYGSQQGISSTLNPYNGNQTISTILYNLAPNTTYHVVGQSSTTSGTSGFCTGVDTTFTTLPLPSVHPAFPAQPVQFDTSTPPAVTGATCTATDQASLQACFNTAVPGDQIVIAAGSTIQLTNPSSAGATTGYQPAIEPGLPPEAKAITCVTNGTCTTSAAHGWSVGQKVRFDASRGDALPNPLNNGMDYYIVAVPTTTSFQVSATLGGSVVTFADLGSNAYVASWPMAQTKYITVRTSAPDSLLPPPGVRVDPAAYANQFATLQWNSRWVSPSGGSGGWAMLGFSKAFAHHYWFTGIKLTTQQYYTSPATTTDPTTFGNMIATTSGNSYIVFDRCYAHGLGYPQRIVGLWTPMEGDHVALINNYIDGFDRARPWKSGLSTTYSGNVVTLPAGTAYIDSNKTCVNASAVNATINAGSVSGTGYLYYTMSCALTLMLPTGVSATGSGFSVVNSATPAYPTDSDGRASVERLASFTLASGTITGVSYFDDASTGSPENQAEGTKFIAAARGPGPYKLENNYISFVGLMLWSDESQMDSHTCVGVPPSPYPAPIDENGNAFTNFCPLQHSMGQVTMRRNTFNNPPKYKTGGPGSDGLNYSNRVQVECKWCDTWLVTGNKFLNGFAQVATGAAFGPVAFVAHVSPNYKTIWGDNDVTFSYNYISNFASVLSGGGTETTGRNIARQCQRGWFHDNIFASINGWTQATFVPGGKVPGGSWTGNLLQSAGCEDWQFTHNTIYDQRGNYNAPGTNFAPLGAIFTNYLVGEGMVWRDNIHTVTGDVGTMFAWGSICAVAGGGACTPNVPDYSGQTDTALLNTLKSQGADIRNNVMVYTYKASGPTGSEVDGSASDATTAAANFSTMTNFMYPAGANRAAREGALKWLAPSVGHFRMNWDSPYGDNGSLRGTDGKAIGADITAVDAEQGKVDNVRATGISSTSATIAWTYYGWNRNGNAGDTCKLVDYELYATYVADGNVMLVEHVSHASAGIINNQLAQSITLTGLTAGSAYIARVNCPTMQPTIPFTTDKVVAANNNWYVATAANGGLSTNSGSSTSSPWDINTAFGGNSLIKPGDTVWIRGGTYTGSFISYINGSSSYPVIIRNYQNERATIDGNLVVYGNYGWYWGLEIMKSSWDRTGGAGGAQDGFAYASSATLVGNKAINLIVHDTLDGISDQQSSSGSELSGNLTYNVGFSIPAEAGTRGHGHGTYVQVSTTDTNVKLQDDNICYNAFDACIQDYGQSGDVRHLYHQGLVAFNSGLPYGHRTNNYVLSGGNDPQSDIVFDTVFSYNPLDASDTGYSNLGSSGGLDLTIKNSVWVGASPNSVGTLSLHNWQTTTFTGNTVVGPLLTEGLAAHTWNSNNYYNATPPVGFDTSSSVTASNPTGTWVYVRKNKYEAGRANIIVYNFPKAATVSVDLSGIGLSIGQAFSIKDVQNYWGSAVYSGSYTGSAINLPMPDSSATVSAFLGTNPPTTPAHTTREFGTFVVLPS